MAGLPEMIAGRRHFRAHTGLRASGSANAATDDPASRGRVIMAQNCEYPGCEKPTRTGKSWQITNTAGTGKDRMSIWLCDKCQVVRRAEGPAFMRWLEERIGTVFT